MGGLYSGQLIFFKAYYRNFAVGHLRHYVLRTAWISSVESILCIFYACRAPNNIQSVIDHKGLLVGHNVWSHALNTNDYCTVCPGGGGDGDSLLWTIRGGSARKGYPFQAGGI